MSDEPLILATLAQFHREVFLPDFERIVRETVAASECRLQAKCDVILQKLEKLESKGAR